MIITQNKHSTIEIMLSKMLQETKNILICS